MKVKDLIEKLQELNQEAEVVMSHEGMADYVGVKDATEEIRSVDTSWARYMMDVVVLSC